MKKMLTVAVVMAMAMTAGQALAQIQIGVHGGYSAGGDLVKNDFGGGAQIVLPLVKDLSLELSGTRYEDVDQVLTIGVTHFAATLRLSTPVLEKKAKVYGGAGISYNSYDVEVSLPGYSVKIEDTMGTHVAAGIETKLTDTINFFVEYRFTWASSTAEVKDDRGNCALVEGDMDFGLWRAGFNLAF